LAAVLLAVVLHPATNALEAMISRFIPLDGESHSRAGPRAAAAGQHDHAAGDHGARAGHLRELAFAGSSGRPRRASGKWTAMAISSLFFRRGPRPVSASLIAFLLGLVLGFLAIQSGSLLPCVLFHAAHNGLALLAHHLLPAADERQQPWRWLLRETFEDGLYYSWPAVLLSVAAGSAILFWFHRLRTSKPAGPVLDPLDREAATLVSP